MLDEIAKAFADRSFFVQSSVNASKFPQYSVAEKNKLDGLSRDFLKDFEVARERFEEGLRGMGALPKHEGDDEDSDGGEQRPEARAKVIDLTMDYSSTDNDDD